MTRSEWEALIETWGGTSVDGEAAGLLRALLGGQATASPAAEVSRVVMPAGPAPPARAADIARVLGQPGAESLASYQPAVHAPAPQQTAVQPSGDTRDEGAIASTVMKTIGLATGVGPVITGLLKLFGGSDTPKQPLFAPIPYSLPEQVSVDAGLASDRSFVGVGYGANGGARALNASRSATPQIQINVQAMDSRSFADHSDDIARAVREAMLQSHSLNDVIAEM